METFVEEGQEIVAELRASVPATDLEVLRRGAHSMKSSAQDFGARTLATLSATLESRARTDWPPDAGATVEQLADAFAAARLDLEGWLAERPA